MIHHEQVHILAYRIAESHHDGRQKEAHMMLEEFNLAIRNLFASLDKLYAA